MFCSDLTDEPPYHFDKMSNDRDEARQRSPVKCLQNDKLKEDAMGIQYGCPLCPASYEGARDLRRHLCLWKMKRWSQRRGPPCCRISFERPARKKEETVLIQKSFSYYYYFFVLCAYFLGTSPEAVHFIIWYFVNISTWFSIIHSVQ